MPRKTDMRKSRRSETSGFNEAAARCRGKRGMTETRVIGSTTRFNEAAARCRGKRVEGREPNVPPLGFNEAAARCRGKRWVQDPATLKICALQ